MLSEEKNRLLVSTGADTPMGALLRRYWMPIAGVSEFDNFDTKPVRIMGEDLTLYRDLSGTFGLVDRHCPHRRADLSYGVVEEVGLRCTYHGWRFDQDGRCVQQPFEDIARAETHNKTAITIKAYPVEVKAGLVWAYLGPQPAPLLPDWEPFSRQNGYVQIVLSEIPCNWVQCQENSIDPVHFEWMHENWGSRLQEGHNASYGPTHLQLEFEEFDYGFVYKRKRVGTSDSDPAWTVGRVCLWPNAFFLGDHFEWRVPIDDEKTLSIMWRFTHVPKDREPYVQTSIPTWVGPLKDAQGNWINTHVMNQDFIAWAGQGTIADRTKEHLGASDRGIVLLRRRFFDELEKIREGSDPKGLIRDPQKNHCVELPIADLQRARDGYTRAEILADPVRLLRFTSYIFQAGQPEWIRQEFSEVTGFEVGDFSGLGKA